MAREMRFFLFSFRFAAVPDDAAGAAGRQGGPRHGQHDPVLFGPSAKSKSDALAGCTGPAAGPAAIGRRSASQAKGKRPDPFPSFCLSSNGTRRRMAIVGVFVNITDDDDGPFVETLQPPQLVCR